ncbi:hypothetical protein FFY45_13375 [Xanthomonas hortorum]|nr:hypothetical protein [Xanthomonas hortorum]
MNPTSPDSTSAPVWSLISYSEEVDVKKRFPVEQIIRLLREADAGVAIKDLCGRHGFSGASLLPFA